MNWFNTKDHRDYINRGFVLIYIPDGLYRFTIANFETGRGWYDMYGHSLNYVRISHWRPLEKPDEGTWGGIADGYKEYIQTIRTGGPR